MSLRDKRPLLAVVQDYEITRWLYEYLQDEEHRRQVLRLIVALEADSLTSQGES